jgi:hypothetical protein
VTASSWSIFRCRTIPIDSSYGKQGTCLQLFRSIMYLTLQGISGAVYASLVRRMIVQISVWVAATVHRWGKFRPFGLAGSLAFLGLAFCVFAWGLQYKLSLYGPPQSVSHQIPKAKLLSRDEQSSTAEHPLVIRTKTSTRVIYTAPTAIFLILLLAVSRLNPPVSRRVERRANRLLHLHRAILNTLFVRPPPALG